MKSQRFISSWQTFTIHTCAPQSMTRGWMKIKLKIYQKGTQKTSRRLSIISRRLFRLCIEPCSNKPIQIYQAESLALQIIKPMKTALNRGGLIYVVWRQLKHLWAGGYLFSLVLSRPRIFFFPCMSNLEKYP